MSNPIYAVIHGHFYQPPRENPWLEIIERQRPAAPFHDWNERITAECYMPNTVSRILNPTGQIDGIVNNFEHISFNIGPTLFAWLERHSPATYAKIIAADYASRSRNNGHGNALAQAFSHMILPLASDSDLETQLIWGIEDFKRRFERPPEGMWLPETAASNRVMAALVRHRIAFTILAPSQAAAVRPIGETNWTDVSKGGLDPRRPYRYFIRDAKGRPSDRHIDIFFFDEPVSRAMSFEHLLTDAGLFADALVAAAGGAEGAGFVNVATDGETFGHHEPFADMCLAFFFDEEAAARGIRPVNHAHYLEIAPVTWEVDIKPGPNSEGTAWSCSHGTGRWQRDCGCATGGPPWWRQTWRAPLRKAFDRLRLKLDAVFSEQAGAFLKDPTAARNDYISVVLDRREETVAAFISRNASRPLEGDDRMKLIRLMESQRHAMYMYTSCGWFFAEIAGLEAVQNMRYAAMAIEMLDGFTEEPLMQDLLDDLAQAPSNVPEMKDGRNVFRRLVWPSMMTMEKVVAARVMSALVTENSHAWQPISYAVESLAAESLPDRYRSSFGMARCKSRTTGESRSYSYYVTQFTPRDVRCYIKRVHDGDEHERLRQRIASTAKANLPRIFEGKFISWGDLLPEVASGIMSALVDQDLETLRSHFTDLFQENLELFEALVTAGAELPYEVRGLVRYALSRLFHNEVLTRRGDWRRDNFVRSREYVDTAGRLGVDIDTRDVDQLVTEDLLAEAEAIKGDLGPRHFQNVISILEVGAGLGLSLRRDLVENIVLEVLEDRVVPWIRGLQDPVRDKGDYEAILGILDMAERLNFSRRRYTQLLAPFEEKLAPAG